MAKQKTGNEEYKRLLQKHEALNGFTDDALERRREWFIQDVINHYDMVEIGTLYFGEIAIDVESIYYDKSEHRLMLHISSTEMEGDIIFTSLQKHTSINSVTLLSGQTAIPLSRSGRRCVPMPVIRLRST